MTAIGFLFFGLALIASFLTFNERKLNVLYGLMTIGCVLMVIGISMWLWDVMP